MKIGLHIFFLLSNLILYAQNEKQNFSVPEIDTVPLNLILPDHDVETSDHEFLKKWNKTKFYVRSVYDYSIIASSMLKSFNDTLVLLSNNRVKKRYLKRANKMLKNEFGDEIKKMTGCNALIYGLSLIFNSVFFKEFLLSKIMLDRLHAEKMQKLSREKNCTVF